MQDEMYRQNILAEEELEGLGDDKEVKINNPSGQPRMREHTPIDPTIIKPYYKT